MVVERKAVVVEMVEQGAWAEVMGMWWWVMVVSEQGRVGMVVWAMRWVGWAVKVAGWPGVVEGMSRQWVWSEEEREAMGVEGRQEAAGVVGSVMRCMGWEAREVGWMGVEEVVRIGVEEVVRLGVEEVVRMETLLAVVL